MAEKNYIPILQKAKKNTVPKFGTEFYYGIFPGRIYSLPEVVDGQGGRFTRSAQPDLFLLT